MKISFSETIKSNQVRQIDFDDVLSMMKYDQSLKLKIDDLRQLQTDQEKQTFKINNLSYFTPGTYRSNIRKKETLISTDTIILDIDHLDDAQHDLLKPKLKTDPKVHLVFTSPSGTGLKVAVMLEREITDPDEYEKIYRSYALLFSIKYNVKVDMHASDCSRACFLSHDADLYFNEQSELINTDELLSSYDAINISKIDVAGKNDQIENIELAIDFLISQNNVTGAIYNYYHNWQLLGLSLAVLGESGRQHFLKLSMGNKKYQDDEDAVNAEFDKLLKHYGQTTKNPVGIGTLYHIAQQHGFVFPANTLTDSPASFTTAAPVSNQPKTIKDKLKEIALLDSEAERDIEIKTLAEKSGASVRSLKNDLKAIMAEKEEVVITNEKIVLAHPSYDVREDFLVIGFKETIVVNNNPEDRNIFIFTDGKEYNLTNEKFLKIGDTRIVFDLRGREMININDRWNKEALNSFLADPAAPVNLYDRIKTVLKEHIEFQKPEHYGIVAAWIIATYFHRCFYAILYLFFFGKKQTAKSRGLDILERLSFNAVKVKGTSVASFVDTVDGLRGAFLTDQAESLSDPRNVEIVGYHADSYTVGGGKRRIVQIVNGNRKVLSFESYGPKGYSAQKLLDDDLRDRTFILSMVRTNKEFPYPAAHLPIWAELRNDLYRLMLTKWQEVQKIYPDTGEGTSMRIRELWRPLETVLILEMVSEKEIADIKKVFLESMAFSQDELSEREIFLIEALLKLTEPKKDDPKGISLSATDIGIQVSALAKAANTDLGFDKDRAMHTWIGVAIKRLSLFTGRDTTKNVRKHQYIFNHNHVNEIFDRFKEKTTGGVKTDQKEISPINVYDEAYLLSFEENLSGEDFSNNDFNEGGIFTES